MAGHSARVRARALPPVAVPEITTDPDAIGAYLEDASGATGTASGLLRPASAPEAAAFLRSTAGRGVRVLPQAARSSLTGGAAPHGEVVLSVERWEALSVDGRRAKVGAGARLNDLQAALAARGLYFPPVPTYQDAMIGGAVATDAGGAATFKYGKTRAWVRGLAVVLANGDLLEIERGEAWASAGAPLCVERSDGSAASIPLPPHRLPALKKISAGYWAADPLDLVDLFVGSEGTLGVIAEVTVDLVPAPAALFAGMAFTRTVAKGLALSRALCEAGERARAGDPREPDVRSVEIVDGRGLALLRAHGDAAKLRVDVPEGAGAALLFEVELPEPLDRERAESIAAEAFEGEAGHPLSRVIALVMSHDPLDPFEAAFPGDDARREALAEFREAVPKRVNEILASRRRSDPAVVKCGGDLLVPPDVLEGAFDAWAAAYEARGLEYAIWGHVSDGNLHPNALPRDAAEVAAARDALFEFAADAVGRGGAPLAEHGVGRSTVKQEMLRRFVGDAAIAWMRDVKRALDPEGRFAPGVVFPV